MGVDELVDLKSQVHDGLKGMPVKRVVSNTVVPLQRALEKNPKNTDAETKLAAELKGHMMELDYFMNRPEDAGYATYESPTTKSTYPGGKVERELEEAVETSTEYCKTMD